MTRIERIYTDFISENPLNPRHPRSIYKVFKSFSSSVCAENTCIIALM